MIFRRELWARFTLTAAVVVFAAAAGRAASLVTPGVDAAVGTVTAVPNKVGGGWVVFVEFTKDFVVASGNDRANATRARNYRIVNMNTGEFAKISEAQIIERPGLVPSQVKLILPDPDDLNGVDPFHLYALGVTFGGEASNAALQGPVQVKAAETPQQAVAAAAAAGGTLPAAAEIKPAWGLKASKDRDDSDVFASYEVTSAKHRATTGTGDVKVRIPFFKTFWKRTSRFGPFVDFKASSDAGADADSLKFGVEWFLPVHVGDDPEASFPYTAVDWINTGKVEAPKNFNNVNAVWESRWLFPSARLLGNGKKFRLFIDPFVGHELGRNLKSPLAEADGKGIARLYAGANLTAQSKIGNLRFLNGFDFNVSYIRRWPLVRELTAKEDESGGAELLAFGRGPKDHLDTKFVFKVNDFFGPFIGFERGRLPPVYKLVDHKWTFGVLFKSKIKVK